MKKKSLPRQKATIEITGLKKKHEFANDPFLKEKHQRALESLKKNPPPEWILKSK